jgi:DNA-directed RNA polymerase specialized sigma24 family protein
LRYIYNMEYEEIADLLNMNNSKSARNLVSRALEHIRNEESGIFILLFLYNQPNFAADILIL